MAFSRQIQRFSSIGLMTITLSFTSLAPSSATTIEVLPQHDSYLVTGGVIHHTNFTRDRQEASVCETCFWKIKEICKSWLDSNHGSCPWLRLQCPADMQLVEVFRANAKYRPIYESKDWYFVSYSCIGDSGPASTVEISNQLSDSWVANVPRLRMKFYPASDAILWHPLKYQILSQSSFSLTKKVLGVQVTLKARSSLDFICRNQNKLENCLSIRANELKFKKVGILQVVTTAQWSATYDALGVVGIEVSGLNPSFTSSQTFNVHPLFTHLASTKGSK
jgi:hypothetical protein